MKVVTGQQDGGKSGTTFDNLIQDSRPAIGENKGVMRAINLGIHISSSIREEGENDLNKDNNELVIVDSKRCRLDQNLGLDEVLNQQNKDVDMGHAYGSVVRPKNLYVVGAALQARLSS